MFDFGNCKGCGFAIEPVYFAGNAPTLCGRCERTLTNLVRHWREQLSDPRMLTHIRFSREYTNVFNHGAPGHLDLITIALLADLLDDPTRML